MELYTVDPTNFSRATVIDEFESVVWTERFIDPGDIRLVLPASFDTVKSMAPASLIGLNTSQELMLTDTRSIENGMLTVTGKTIDGFFNEQFIGSKKITGRPAWILRYIVQSMQNRWGSRYAIPGLVMGEIANSDDDPVEEKIAYGPAASELLRIAKQYDIGLSVYWTDNDIVGNDLVFSTRIGEDRRGEILFSPELDNLSNIKELLSDVNSKYVIIAHPPKGLSISEYVNPIHISYAGDINPPTFIRVLEIDCDDIDEPMLSDIDIPFFTKVQRLKELMRRKARRQLLGLKKTKVVDGEITSESQFKYYTQYNPYGDPVYRLGDIVSIGGNFTDSIDGVVTEYIQSSDATGERAYPTVVPLSDTTTAFEEGSNEDYEDVIEGPQLGGG